MELFDNREGLSASSHEDISHTGSGGAFEGTERPAKEFDREESDEHLDERLENTETGKRKRPPVY
jgi:hypothetical protein